MNKEEFLFTLRNKLKGLPAETIESAIDYYSELIDDAMEDGTSENEAVESLGSISDIAYNVIADTPLKKIIETKKQNKPKLNGWKVAFFIITAPLWIPIIFVVGIISLSVLLAIVIGVVAVFALLIGLTLFGIILLVYSIFYYVRVSLVNAVFIAGLSLLCIGAGIVTIDLAKKLFVLIKTGIRNLISRLKNDAVKKG